MGTIAGRARGRREPADRYQHVQAAQNPPGGLIGGYVVPTQTTTTPPPGPLFAYLPLVTRDYGAEVSELEADKTYSMSSAGLSNGQYYYFVLKLEDGYNTVYWYSELPVKKIP